MVKRDTSNQNESYETKTSIKRAALNRDQSATSNRLKQEYMPNYYNRQFDTEREMQTLQETTEQIRLSPGPGLPVERPRPRTLAQEGRISTMDIITNDLMARPSAFMAEHRMTTIDALELDLDGPDSILKSEDLLDDSYRISASSLSSLPKPASLGMESRLTTQEFFEIVSAPIATVEDKSGNDYDPLPLVQ